MGGQEKNPRSRIPAAGSLPACPELGSISLGSLSVCADNKKALDSGAVAMGSRIGMLPNVVVNGNSYLRLVATILDYICLDHCALLVLAEWFYGVGRQMPLSLAAY